MTPTDRYLTMMNARLGALTWNLAKANKEVTSARAARAAAHDALEKTEETSVLASRELEAFIKEMIIEAGEDMAA